MPPRPAPRFVAGDQIWFRGPNGQWLPGVICEPHQYDASFLTETPPDVGDVVAVGYHDEQSLMILPSHNPEVVRPLDYSVPWASDPSIQRFIALAKLDARGAQRRREDFLARGPGPSVERSVSNSQARPPDSPYLTLSAHDQRVMKEYLKALGPENRRAVLEALRSDGLNVDLEEEEADRRPPAASVAPTPAPAAAAPRGVAPAGQRGQGQGQVRPEEKRKRAREDDTSPAKGSQPVPPQAQPPVKFSVPPAQRRPPGWEMGLRMKEIHRPPEMEEDTSDSEPAPPDAQPFVKLSVPPGHGRPPGWPAPRVKIPSQRTEENTAQSRSTTAGAISRRTAPPPPASCGPRPTVVQPTDLGKGIIVQVVTGWDADSLGVVETALQKHSLTDSSDGLPAPFAPRTPTDRAQPAALNGDDAEAGPPPTDYMQYPPALGPEWELLSVVAAAKVNSQDVDAVCEISEAQRIELGKYFRWNPAKKSLEAISGSDVRLLLLPLSEAGDTVRSWMESTVKKETDQPGETDGGLGGSDLTLWMRIGVGPAPPGIKPAARPTRKRSHVENPSESVCRTKAVPPPWHEAVGRPQYHDAPRTAIPVDVTDTFCASFRPDQAGSGKTASTDQVSPIPREIAVRARFLGPGREILLPDDEKLREEMDAQLWDGTVALVLVRKRSMAQIVAWVLKWQEGLLKRHGSATALITNDQAEVERFSFDGKCAVSLQKITIPVRGLRCVHTAPLDLEVVIKRGLETHLWTCPLCHEPLPLRDIMVDRELQLAMEESDFRSPTSSVTAFHFVSGQGYSVESLVRRPTGDTVEVDDDDS